MKIQAGRVCKFCVLLAIGGIATRHAGAGAEHSQSYHQWGAAVQDARDARLLEDGIRQADDLRRRWCGDSSAPLNRVEQMTEALNQFAAHSTSALGARPGLERFPRAKDWLRQAVCQGTTADEIVRVFNAFGGRWHGRWETNLVDHRWDKTVTYHPPRTLPGLSNLFVHAVQYAWIGDGFGWNIAASERESSRDWFILGSVYHVIDGDPRRIRLHRPHLGVCAGRGRLVWLTDGEAFFEEVTGAGSDAEKYAITGFYHRWNSGRVERYGQGFQAIYTRQPDNRPDFIRFDLPGAR